MVTQWGQFLDHDITLTPETHAEDCCEHAEDDENCFPINVPSVDPFYSSRLTGAVRCLEFTRSTAFCEEDHERADTHREQINGMYQMYQARKFLCIIHRKYIVKIHIDVFLSISIISIF